MGKLNSAGFLTGTAAVDGDFNVFSAAARDDWWWFALGSSGFHGFPRFRAPRLLQSVDFALQ